MRFALLGVTNISFGIFTTLFVRESSICMASDVILTVPIIPYVFALTWNAGVSALC
jgi:hypothetical protein